MKFLTKISVLKGKKARGVHINILADGQYNYYFTDVVLSKSTLKIINQASGTEKPENAIHIISKDNLPLIISLDGKGILHKTIIPKNSIEPNELLVEYFPNIDTENVLYQVSHVNDEFMAISIIKIDAIDSFKELLDKNLIFSFFLGFFNIEKTISQINEEIDNIIITGKNIKIKDNHISSYQNIDDNSCTYSIDEYRLSGDQIIAYSNSLQYFINDNSTKYIFEDKNLPIEFIAKKALKKIGIGTLIFFFVTLLANFLVFDHFNKLTQKYSIQCTENEHLFIQQQELAKELKYKKDFIKKCGFLQSSKMSLIADEIALSLPEDIILSKLQINPLKGTLKQNEPTEFEYNKIIIEGICSSPEDLNFWISKINQIFWIKETIIEDFFFDESQGKAKFSIVILTESL
ncbi:MAG: hypothetical protein JXR48_01930 [Candidatus Delongbacteria bacterium]|nr:hypothetical protein [Candidatus Delongbacteria bacterium]